MIARHYSWGVALLVLAAAACVDRLPDQDRRIIAATPAAKMSVDLLWQEFKADPVKAARDYHGRVVEITGVATAPGEGQIASLTFAQPEGGKVIAALLADRAAAVADAAKASPRITIRCYVEGRPANSASTDVLLKSCVLP